MHSCCSSGAYCGLQTSRAFQPSSATSHSVSTTLPCHTLQQHKMPQPYLVLFGLISLLMQTTQGERGSRYLSG